MKNLKLIFIVFFLVFGYSSISAQEMTLGEAEHSIRIGDFEDAIIKLNLYIEENPTDEKAYIDRAIAYGNLGQFQEKSRDLNYAKMLNPFAYMYVSSSMRSRLYEKKNYEYDFDNVSKDFTKSPVKEKYYNIYFNEIKDQHAQDSLISKAIYYLSKNDLTNTELILAQIDYSPKIQGIIYDMEGLIALKKNNLDDAIELFSKSIELMPAFSLAYHNRAIAYKLKGDYEASQNDLEFALSLNEDISVFYFTLAKLSELLEDNEEAKAYYLKALDKNPNYIEARTNYSLLQKTLGNYSESMLNLQQMVDSSDKISKANFIKGGIHLTYGEYENAVIEFDKYLTKNVNDSDAIFNRGLAKLLQGKKREGCEDITTSIDINFNMKRDEINKAFCSGI